MQNPDRHDKYKHEQQMKFKKFGAVSKATTLDSMLSNMVMSSKPKNHQPIEQKNYLASTIEEDFGSFNQAGSYHTPTQQKTTIGSSSTVQSQQQKEIAATIHLPIWLQNPQYLPIVYHQVFEASVASDGLVDTGRVYHILLQSLLSTETLGQLWSLANMSVPGRLNQQELYVLLALIALVQNGDTSPSIQKLSLISTALTPTFHINSQQPTNAQQQKQEAASLPTKTAVPAALATMKPPTYEEATQVNSTQSQNDDDFGDFAEFQQFDNNVQDDSDKPSTEPQHQLNLHTDSATVDDFSDFAVVDTVNDNKSNDSSWAQFQSSSSQIPSENSLNQASINSAGLSQQQQEVASEENSGDKYAAFKDDDQMNLFTFAFASTIQQQQQSSTDAEDDFGDFESTDFTLQTAAPTIIPNHVTLSSASSFDKNSVSSLDLKNNNGSQQQQETDDPTREHQQAATCDAGSLGSAPDHANNDFGDYTTRNENADSFGDFAQQDKKLDIFDCTVEQDKMDDNFGEFTKQNKKDADFGDFADQGQNSDGFAEFAQQSETADGFGDFSKEAKSVGQQNSADSFGEFAQPTHSDHDETFSPPPLDNFHEDDEDEFGDFPSPQLTAAAQPSASRSALAHFDAFADLDEEEERKTKEKEKERKLERKVLERQSKMSGKASAHFDLSALNDCLDDNEKKNDKKIHEELANEDSVPISEKENVVVDEIPQVNEQPSHMKDVETEKQPQKYEPNETVNAKDEEKLQNLFELWQRALQGCWEILTLANDVLTSIQSPQVCKEVVYSLQGQRFVQDLSAVHGVAERISESFTETYDAGDSRLKVCATLCKQIDLAWNNVLAFCPNTPILEEVASKDGSPNKHCQICLRPISNYGNLIEFASASYHNTCANLWVNNVDSILPSLNY